MDEWLVAGDATAMANELLNLVEIVTLAGREYDIVSVVVDTPCFVW